MKLWVSEIQKQSFADVFQNSCSQKVLKPKGLAILLKRDSNIGIFVSNLRNFYEHLFLQNIYGGCFWKSLMNPLFIAYENDEWCHFVVRISSPALIHFIPCVSFLSIFFFFYHFFVDSTTC